MKILSSPAFSSRAALSALLAGLTATTLCAASSASKGGSAGSNKPTVVTPPAVRQGAVEERAPFPAARQFDQTRQPNPKALEKAPSSTPATPSAPPLAPSNVRIRVVREGTPGSTAASPADPGSLPTGRSLPARLAPLDTPTFVPRLRAAALADRERVVDDVDARLSKADTVLGSVESSSREMSKEGLRTFNSAADEVKDKAKALRKSLQAARKADATEWDDARAQLAADYASYAQALARMDVAVGVSPPTR